MDGSVCWGDRRAEARLSRKAASVWGALVLMTGVSLLGCAKYSDIGVFQDRSGNWFAYALSGGERGGMEVAYLALSKRRVQRSFDFETSDSERRVVVSGETYVLPRFREGNLYLVREDGTIYRSPYFVSEKELHSFQNLLNVSGWSDIFECARKSLDPDRLDKESRKFLGVD